MFEWLKKLLEGFRRNREGGDKAKVPVGTDSVRETLFGDMPLDQWPSDGAGGGAFPWSAFVVARNHLNAGNREAAASCWHSIVQTLGVEPRHTLQAWHFLRTNGHQPPPAIAGQILGVVVEVMLPQGLDLLAIYPDHSARYYNHSGAGIVWEHPDDSLSLEIDQLIESAQMIVAQIGPWNEQRPGPPPRGHVRLNFLTPSGLHFGQGPFDALAKDPRGGRVVLLATSLMQALVGKTGGQRP